MEVYGTEFLVDNANLGFVATDREKNLTVFMYQPDSVHSSGGTILLKKADMNIGSWCVTFEDIIINSLRKNCLSWNHRAIIYILYYYIQYVLTP